MEDEVLDLTRQLAASGVPFMTEIGPLIVATVAMGVARDSRSFARMFDLAHALVLRECVHVHDDLNLLDLEDRGEKSGRLFLHLTQKGQSLIAGEAVA